MLISPHSNNIKVGAVGRSHFGNGGTLTAHSPWLHVLHNQLTAMRRSNGGNDVRHQTDVSQTSSIHIVTMVGLWTWKIQ